MADPISTAEWIAEMNRLMNISGSPMGQEEGWMSVKELTELTGRSLTSVKNAIARGIKEGTLEKGFRMGTSADNKACRIPVYRRKHSTAVNRDSPSRDIPGSTR